MALDMDAIVPGLLEAHSHLELWFVARNKVATIVDTKLSKGHRQLRSALLTVLADDALAAFRIHADNMACLAEDLGTSPANLSPYATSSAVDMFFGPTLFNRKTAASRRLLHPHERADTRHRLDAHTRAAITNLEKRARPFINSVRELPHESAKRRMRTSLRQVLAKGPKSPARNRVTPKFIS